MRSIFILICAFGVLLMHSSFVIAEDGVNGSAFFQTLPDVPMMDGMHEREDLTFIFDKPEGRIVEALAHLEGLSAAQIRNYYSNALPQLGWQENASDEFVRDAEKMSMQFEEDFLKITIEPR